MHSLIVITLICFGAGDWVLIFYSDEGFSEIKRHKIPMTHVCYLIL
jgi:hypothetical protein